MDKTLHQAFHSSDRRQFLARETDVLKAFLNAEWQRHQTLDALLSEMHDLDVRGRDGDVFTFAKDTYFAGGHSIEDTGISNATLERVTTISCNSAHGHAATVKIGLSLDGRYTMLFSGAVAPLSYATCETANDIVDGLHTWLNALENRFGIPALKTAGRPGTASPDYAPIQP